MEMHAADRRPCSPEDRCKAEARSIFKYNGTRAWLKAMTQTSDQEFNSMSKRKRQRNRGRRLQPVRPVGPPRPQPASVPVTPAPEAEATPVAVSAPEPVADLPVSAPQEYAYVGRDITLMLITSLVLFGGILVANFVM